MKPTYGYAKEGAGRGHSGVGVLNALIGVVGMPGSAPLITGARLRRGRPTGLPCPVTPRFSWPSYGWKSGLKMPDCCVLLAAITCHGAVATVDNRLANVATARHIRTLSS